MSMSFFYNESGLHCFLTFTYSSTRYLLMTDNTVERLLLAETKMCNCYIDSF
jgi:hypothetical protein